ncbi:uncharacterized peptidase C1-like protein F26E4.3 [Gordionus sp. m RMFG-2023]|uniref:uncharacterized peptidase C1-like protein F26E4.3 n=1 Tax=Gordionus sp. m RMFG-2023 TaxID=3053472 RepID=UPI0031FBAAA4
MSYRTVVKKYYCPFLGSSAQILLVILVIFILLSQSLVDSNSFEMLSRDNGHGGLNLSNGRRSQKNANSRNRAVNNEGKCLYDEETYDIGTGFKINCNLCICQDKEFKCKSRVCLIRPEIIKEINNSNKGWKASNYSDFWGLTLAEGKKYKLGTLHISSSLLRTHNVGLTLGENEILEESFDSRKKWGPYINPIRNQLNCSSSWAISAADVAGDRSGIIGLRKGLTTLSPQYLISCNKGRGKQKGCQGGHIDIGKDTECRNKKSPSISENVDCLKNQSHFLKFTPPYKVSKNERSIRIEILLNGPVQATMVVRQDLFVYKSGIYTCPKVEEMAKNSESSAKNAPNSNYHSVRILGWGQLDTSPYTKYWIVANSWGQQWGESGTFRIVRGHNECEIENCIIGIWPSKNNI